MAIPGRKCGKDTSEQGDDEGGKKEEGGNSKQVHTWWVRWISWKRFKIFPPKQTSRRSFLHRSLYCQLFANLLKWFISPKPWRRRREGWMNYCFHFALHVDELYGKIFYCDSTSVSLFQRKHLNLWDFRSSFLHTSQSTSQEEKQQMFSLASNTSKRSCSMSKPINLSDCLPSPSCWPLSALLALLEHHQ